MTTEVEIMRLANRLIGALMLCANGGFVDEVIGAIGCAEPFTEERIREVAADEFNGVS